MHVDSDSLEQFQVVCTRDARHVMIAFRISSCNSCDHVGLVTNQIRTKPPRVWVGQSHGFGWFGNNNQIIPKLNQLMHSLFKQLDLAHVVAVQVLSFQFSQLACTLNSVNQSCISTQIVVMCFQIRQIDIYGSCIISLTSQVSIDRSNIAFSVIHACQFRYLYQI